MCDFGAVGDGLRRVRARSSRRRGSLRAAPGSYRTSAPCPIGRAVGGQPRADLQRHPHDAGAGDARDIDDVVAGQHRCRQDSFISRSRHPAHERFGEGPQRGALQRQTRARRQQARRQRTNSAPALDGIAGGDQRQQTGGAPRRGSGRRAPRFPSASTPPDARREFRSHRGPFPAIRRDRATTALPALNTASLLVERRLTISPSRKLVSHKKQKFAIRTFFTCWR